MEDFDDEPVVFGRQNIVEEIKREGFDRMLHVMEVHGKVIADVEEATGASWEALPFDVRLQALVGLYAKVMGYHS